MHPIVGTSSWMLHYRGQRRYGPLASVETEDYLVRRVLVPSLVRLEVSTGHVIEMTPETVFGLIKTAGKPVIYNPLHASGVVPAIHPPAWDARIEDFILDWRSWVLRGLLLTCGTYSATTPRPARISLPAGSEIAQRVVDYLRLARETFDYRLRLGPVKISVAESGGMQRVTCRLLDWLCEGFLTPVDMTFAVPDCLERIGPEAAHGLAYGIWLGTQPFGVFQHRSANVVMAVKDFLFYRFGLTGDLHLHPMEPDFQFFGKGIRNPHRLDLHHPDLLFTAHERGRDPRRFAQATVKYVTAVPLGDAYELVPRRPSATFFAVNGFLLESRIEVPAGALDLAAELAAGGGEHFTLLDPIYEG